MRRALRVLVFAAAVLFMPLLARAGEHEHQPVQTSQDFNSLKGLAGAWEGKNENAKPGAAPIALEYRITSNGSAVVETLFKGQPEEMVTIYNDDNGGLTMTHYCALGNQPRLKLQSREGNSMLFEFVDGMNMKSANDPHMHRLKLTMLSGTKLRHEWTHYNEGKPTDTTAFVFERKNAGR